MLYALWRKVSSHHANSHLYKKALVLTLASAIADRRVQLVEMEETFGWARWLRQASKVPVCVRLHGPWFQVGPALGFPNDAHFRQRVEQEKRAILKADAITAPSHDILDKTRAFYGLPLSNAEVIPNPVVPASESWQLDHADPKQLLFIGRFDRLKGGDLIIDAFAQVLEEIPDAKLWFIGPDRGCRRSSGRTWHIEEYIRYRLSKAWEVKQIEWLGPLPFSSLAAFRRRALVTVVCSLYENFPYSLIEAMALGCPLVAARVGGIPEIIRDHANGLLHRPSDSADLADKLVSLLKNPVWASELGRQAVADCQRYYYPEVITAQLVAFYQKVICQTVERTKAGIR
jgi:glycosyltransferase involved in cell wall biosynthesis